MSEQRLSKPNLYLDVDGVILPLGEFSETQFPFEMRKISSLEYYSPEVVERLGNRALNLVWCTTWGAGELKQLQERMDALRGGRQLALPPVSRGVSRISQKLDTILADQANNTTPFVWVDDAITSSERDRVSMLCATTPHLIIQPNKCAGISQDQLASLEEFADSFGIPIV